MLKRFLDMGKWLSGRRNTATVDLNRTSNVLTYFDGAVSEVVDTGTNYNIKYKAGFDSANSEFSVRKDDTIAGKDFIMGKKNKPITVGVDASRKPCLVIINSVPIFVRTPSSSWANRCEVLHSI